MAMWAISGGMLIAPVLQRKRLGDAVNANGAVALMNRDKALLLDVRTLELYNKASVVQAQSAPEAELSSSAVDFVKHACLIVMDADGKTAHKAAAILRKAGAPRVVVLEGGYAAWVAAGLPVKSK